MNPLPIDQVKIVVYGDGQIVISRFSISGIRYWEIINKEQIEGQQ
jgi:hypothetical protein